MNRKEAETIIRDGLRPAGLDKISGKALKQIVAAAFECSDTINHSEHYERESTLLTPTQRLFLMAVDHRRAGGELARQALAVLAKS